MWGVLESFLRMKGAKIGAGVLGAGGTISLVFGLHSDLKAEIAKAETTSKKHAAELVGTAQKITDEKLNSIARSQEKILKAIEKLDDRIYKLNNKNN